MNKVLIITGIVVAIGSAYAFVRSANRLPGFSGMDDYYDDMAV